MVSQTTLGRVIAMPYLDLGSQVEKFGVLIGLQRLLIEELEKNGADPTSEKIILESFQASLSLCAGNPHLMRYNIQIQKPLAGFAACASRLAKTEQLRIAPFARGLSVLRLNARKWKDLAKRNKFEEQNQPPAHTENIGQPSKARFEFNFSPLTDQEKIDFMKSIAAKTNNEVIALPRKQLRATEAA